MSQSILTPKFRSSYANVFTPRGSKSEPDKKKFSITALFSADAEVPRGSISIKEMKKVALAAVYEKWGDTDDTRRKIKAGKIRMPFIEGDRLQSDIDDGKVPKGTVLMMRFNSSATSRPGVVDRYRGPDGKAMVLEDEEQFYSGCYARADVKPYVYDRDDGKGVTFVLNNVQKLGEGERLAGRRPASEAFAETDFDDTPPEMGGVKSKSATEETDDDDPMGLGLD